MPQEDMVSHTKANRKLSVSIFQRTPPLVANPNKTATKLVAAFS